MTLTPATPQTTRRELDELLLAAIELAPTRQHPETFLVSCQNWHRNGDACLARADKRRNQSLYLRDLRDATWYAEQIRLAIAGKSPYGAME